MEKSIIRIHDLATDTIIDREMTDKEQKDYDSISQIMQNDLSLKKAAKETAEAKLAALGLTTDDLKALGL